MGLECIGFRQKEVSQSAVGSLFLTSGFPARRSLGEGVALLKTPFSRGEGSPYGQWFAVI